MTWLMTSAGSKEKRNCSARAAASESRIAQLHQPLPQPRLQPPWQFVAQRFLDLGDAQAAVVTQRNAHDRLVGAARPQVDGVDGVGRRRDTDVGHRDVHVLGADRLLDDFQSLARELFADGQAGADGARMRSWNCPESTLRSDLAAHLAAHQPQHQPRDASAYAGISTQRKPSSRAVTVA